jgi:hypothetical protein
MPIQPAPTGVDDDVVKLRRATEESIAPTCQMNFLVYKGQRSRYVRRDLRPTSSTEERLSEHDVWTVDEPASAFTNLGLQELLNGSVLVSAYKML